MKRDDDRQKPSKVMYVACVVTTLVAYTKHKNTHLHYRPNAWRCRQVKMILRVRRPNICYVNRLELALRFNQNVYEAVYLCRKWRRTRHGRRYPDLSATKVGDRPSLVDFSDASQAHHAPSIRSARCVGFGFRSMQQHSPERPFYGHFKLLGRQTSDNRAGNFNGNAKKASVALTNDMTLITPQWNYIWRRSVS